MTERSMVEAAARLRRHGEPYLVATVVCVGDTGYRRPGARMILTRFRWVAGSVSGGCLEGDISSKGWSLTRDGEPVLVTYDSARMPEGADDVDIRSAFGLCCDGVVEVMLERAGTPGRIDALEFAARCLRGQRRGAVVTVFRSDVPGVRVGSHLALAAGGELEEETQPIEAGVRDAIAADMRDVLATGISANRTYATPSGRVDAFIEVVLPPPRLFVFGSGHDAVPVVQLARHVGWDVVVCVAEPKFSTRERLGMADEILCAGPAEIAARINASDRAIAVVMGHDYERDREHVGMLVGTRARYIGVLGPRSRTERMLAELSWSGDPRIHAPAGLELGADTPHEISLAIIAEAQVALSRVPAIHRSDDVGRVAEPIPDVTGARLESVTAA
jgi:xanthine dehydrogenase accessory factor